MGRDAEGGSLASRLGARRRADARQVACLDGPGGLLLHRGRRPEIAPTSWSTETTRRACPETNTRSPSVPRNTSRATSGHAAGVTDLPVVVDYRSDWPMRAAALSEHLRRELGSSAERIEHIGSTAIPGMAAKDVLDLQASVTDLARAAETFDGPPIRLGFRRSPYEHDHVPTGSTDDPSRWASGHGCDAEPGGRCQLPCATRGVPERTPVSSWEWLTPVAAIRATPRPGRSTPGGVQCEPRARIGRGPSCRSGSARRARPVSA